jgi:hypothetical protein
VIDVGSVGHDDGVGVAGVIDGDGVTWWTAATVMGRRHHE